MKIAYCLGIRPDFIINSILIEMLDDWLKENFILVHTGQHYSYNMDKIFFEELGIRNPNYHLGIGSGAQGYQTGETIRKSEEVFIKENPDLVLGFSDGNPVLSCIAATKLKIKVAHIEAGFRSWDWRMPEEKNRRLIDSISDIFFVPTTLAQENLIREGVSETKIFITSKLIVEVLEKYKRQIDDSKILEKLHIKEGEYFLVTGHRPENVENKTYMSNILKALKIIYEKYSFPLIFPAHPRTQAAIKRFNLEVPKGVRIMDYLGFFDFSKLEKNAFCIITDSGTVQEDGCWFKVPCVTFRISTERPETEYVGSNIVCGLDTEDIVDSVDMMVDEKRDWNCPYYLGAAKKIISVLKMKEDEIKSKKVWW